MLVLEKEVIQVKRGCDNCLFGACKKIGPRGNPEATFVVVGESPGSQELKRGIPFVGPSGEVLDANIPPDMDIFITNALSCKPRKKDPKVLSEAVSRCSGRLLEEIREHPRKVILALGNGALWALTGNHNLKITQERGKLFKSDLAEIGIVATIHPAYLLRGGGSYRKVQADIQYAVDLANGKNTKHHIVPEIIIHKTEKEVTDFVKMAKEHKLQASDIETSGFSGREDKLLSIGFSWDPKEVHIIEGNEEGDIEVPYWHSKKKIMVPELINSRSFLSKSSTSIQLIKSLLESPDIEYIWHNGKFDCGFLRPKGIHVVPHQDTMLLNYVLDETRGIHDLETVASDVLGAPDWKDVIAKYLPRKGASYAYIPQDELSKYQGFDISNTLQIFSILRERVARDPALEKYYTKTLVPANEFLIDVQNTGFLIDWDVWEENRVRLEVEVQELRDTMSKLAGYTINPGSPKQMVTFLYDELKLPTKIRSTNKDVVKKLPNHPAVKCLREYRTKNKQYTTYVIGMIKNVESDNRAHPNFLIHGTRTSRLACRNPNLQNVPPKMRPMFKAKEGYILLDVDYSQAELRTLATLSGDPALIAIFCDTNRSIHKEVAIEKFGPDYTPAQYVRAKGYNFGIVYGRTCFSIAEEFDITTKQAQQEIDDWFKQFPIAHKLIKNCRNAPAKMQTLVTKFGNKCRPGLVTDFNLREVQNEFANFPHQATASNCTLHAAMKSDSELKALNAQIINLVHDSIIIELPDNKETINKTIEIMKRNMMQVPIDWGLDKVPFLVDYKLCYQWEVEFPAEL